MVTAGMPSLLGNGAAGEDTMPARAWMRAARMRSSSPVP
ncbi:hypothetical protein XCR_2556 [Xanthomonas campestris pv. raphani 756C]|nr:hypothetical protein XCR_2556 [Xanthomonas campestris pv. raphani 756C]